jgi:hypothetical protein
MLHARPALRRLADRHAYSVRAPYPPMALRPGHGAQRGQPAQLMVAEHVDRPGPLAGDLRDLGDVQDGDHPEHHHLGLVGRQLSDEGERPAGGVEFESGRGRVIRRHLLQEFLGALSAAGAEPSGGASRERP